MQKEFDDLLQYFPGKPKKITTIPSNYPIKINQQLIDQIIIFISKSVKDLSSLGLNKAIIGLSGGIDSSVAAVLLKKALPEQSFGVIVDLEDDTGSADIERAVQLATDIGLDYKVIKAGKIYKAQLDLLGDNNSLAILHLRSRFINNIIFQIADNKTAAVIDTTDKSEKVLGRHVEAFLGHIAPLVDIYKTQVYELANLLDIPQSIINNSPGCPELLDIDAFGVPWATIDPILSLLVDKHLTLQELVQSYDVDEEWLSKIKFRIDNQPLRLNATPLLLD